jgi:thiol-disulfide isomerase/thioredoxin
MKKTYILLLILFLAGNLQAQIYWLIDLEKAKSIASETNKLIVIDFWASWCGPCNAMDQNLWQNPDMKEISRNFVGVKINTDNDRATAMAYGVTGIPKVVIATAAGEAIWENVGFSSAEPYLTILRAIPDKVGELNKSAVALESGKKDPKINYDLGLAFQHIGKDIKSENLRNSFLNNSGTYFAKAQKLSKDENLNMEIEFYSILNDVYYGKPAKALKKMEKIGSKPGNENLEEIRHYVLAKCYFGSHDQDNFQKEKKLISSKELLAQLE